MNNSNSLIQKLKRTKHKNLLTHSLCRSAYIPKKSSFSHVKKFFAKFFELEKETIDESLLTSMEITSKTNQIKNKNKPTINKVSETPTEQLIKNALVIHSKSPTLKIRKSVTRPVNIGTNSSLIVKRVNLKTNSQTRPKSKNRIRNRFENSNYTSYSDIYQSILKNLPQLPKSSKKSPYF